jgi:hypothetical protein
MSVPKPADPKFKVNLTIPASLIERSRGLAQYRNISLSGLVVKALRAFCYCPECGEPVPPERMTCAGCGASLPLRRAA